MCVLSEFRHSNELVVLWRVLPLIVSPNSWFQFTAFNRYESDCLERKASYWQL